MTDLGTYTRCYTITFERRSKHPPARLWRAITDADDVSRWMAYPARIDLRVGGDYFVDFSRTNEGELDGVIVKLQPERLLRYAWGTSVVEWAIEPEGAGSRHVFLQTGLAFRPIPDEEGLAAGWHVWLEDLEQYLDTGAPSPDDDGRRRWAELGKLYRPLLEAVSSG
jgi:uncharacterized protein YndB with AHSA1/START domain